MWWSADKFFLFLNFLMVLRVILHASIEARDGFSEYRWINLWRAGLGCVYALSYVFVLTGTIDRLLWSQIMVAVSLMMWDIVWTRPVLAMRKLRKELVARGVRRIDQKRKAA